MICKTCGTIVTSEYCHVCGGHCNNPEDLKRTTENTIIVDYQNIRPSKKDGWILGFGIASLFLGPFFAIITLLLSNGYNSSNNYLNSPDAKVGKICAIISLILDCVALIFIIASFNSVMEIINGAALTF